jgi:hypothetical protein
MNIDMENLCYNDWKSRQHVKRREDNYKEYVKSSPIAQLMDEALKSLVNNKTHHKPNNSRRVAL